MRCDEARARIGPLIDGEVPGDERRALIAHAEDCPECARYRDELDALRSRLAGEREAAPRMLMHRVRARLAVEAAAPSVPASPSGAHAGRYRRWLSMPGIERLRPYLSQAAMVSAACMVSIAVTVWWVRGMETGQALARDVLSAHVRALLQDNPVQIASLDTHTVKPWFAGRLEFTPVVKDLSAEGFQLAGGRLDYVGGRRVAALVYQRRLHKVSVFIWPAAGATTAPSRATINGYNIVLWTKAGMSLAAVSDLNEAELRELQLLL